MTEIAPLVLWHAALMLLAWMVLVPAGLLVARYFKVTRTQKYPQELDNTFWWHSHKRLQYGAWLLTNVAAVLVIYPYLSAHGIKEGLQAAWPRHPHAWFGVAVLLLVWLQVVSAWLRGSKGGPVRGWQTMPALLEVERGDHYDMTLHRRVFEGWHKLAGYLVWLLAMAAGQTGLVLMGAPGSVISAHALMSALPLLLFVMFAQQKRWVPTYQAIWGPDPRHPGNQAGKNPSIDK